LYKEIIKPILFSLDAEKAHKIAFTSLKLARNIPGLFSIIEYNYSLSNKLLNKSYLGLNFPNAMGLAAGFDKNAELIDEWFKLGFGFVEIGTVTPKPQSGNPAPRLFRLPKDYALINRMGFNNHGMDEVYKNLNAKSSRGIVGVNIGKNKDTPNDEAFLDYIKCFKTLHPNADYFVINVSSPNTPGLRELQEKEPLLKIISEVQNINFGLQKKKPVLLKIAPELNTNQIEDIAFISQQTKLDGIIATNTSTGRAGLNTAKQTLESIGNGGLSGKPVKEISTNIVKQLKSVLPKHNIIVGCGGIFNYDDLKEKSLAGADLFQVYTGFVYEGPGIVKTILKEYLKEFHG
jgi:dihydroorotate dehydrogenase